MPLDEEEINLYCITPLKFQSLYLLFQHSPNYPDLYGKAINSPRVMGNGCKHYLWNNIFESVNYIILRIPQGFSLINRIKSEFLA